MDPASATRVETLIIGFGFSAIPLLRELEARGQPYTLLSHGTPIWQQLAASDRLEFDLVSSFHASFYVQDQVAAGVIDNYYPTAREFYEYHERIFAPFRDKIIDDYVVSVDNHTEHSVVCTSSGKVYEARNVVFATGLGRPQNETIKELDLRGIEGQTLVFNTIGDTANMMVARAVAQGNKVILLNDGFVNLDKYVTFETPGPKSQWYLPIFGVRTGKRYALDLAQLEFHNVGRLWPKFYKDLFAIPLGPPEPESLLARTLLPHKFHVRFPDTYRRERIRANADARAGHANGMSGIKYWPIDMYEQRFGHELDDRIRQGVLVNDLTFFHLEGLVETWPKHRATVDMENQSVRCDGRVERFDHFIDGGAELPRLPPIFSVSEDGTRHRYTYAYRGTYLGVVPQDLRNVYFIGYTRPFTGGLANMTEMQALMIHKLLSEPERAATLQSEIHQRVEDYNAYYYPTGKEQTPTDHLVNYGLYTADVAEFVGIGRKFSSALSWNPWKTFLNLRFELLHPNNALKFRMQGEYAVEGAEALGRKIAAHNEHWSILMFLLLAVFWDVLLGYLFVALVFLDFVIEPLLALPPGGLQTGPAASLVAWTAVSAGMGVLLHKNRRLVMLSTYSLTVPLFGLKAATMPLAMIYIAVTGQWALCPLLFGFWAAMAWAFRQFHKPPISGRYLFADCKFKHEYRPFWERYQERYLAIQRDRKRAAMSNVAAMGGQPPAADRAPREAPDLGAPGPLATPAGLDN
ncbi:MAG: hypothetical protein KC933_08750 [Myxococcales bacterium]|nr:hypothetical protein [Myxococcales bacterium]